VKIRTRRDEPVVDSVRAKAFERMDRLSRMEILDWADMAGSGVARALQDYRRHETPESLEEARIGLQSLLGCVDAIQKRAQ